MRKVQSMDRVTLMEIATKQRPYRLLVFCNRSEPRKNSRHGSGLSTNLATQVYNGRFGKHDSLVLRVDNLRRRDRGSLMAGCCLNYTI